MYNSKSDGMHRRTVRFHHAARRTLPAKGFTLVELLVTMTVMAILIALAVPVLSTPHTASEANALLGAVQFARSSAIKQGQAVVVCASANPGAATPTCAGGSTPPFSTGWIVFAPIGGLCTGTSATGDRVLQTFPALKSGDTAVFSPASGNSNTGFCFTRSGFSFSGYSGIVQIDTNPVNLNLRRCMVISGVGHAQVLTHGQSDVNAVACP